MVDFEGLGYIIRDARETRRMSQKALGRKVGLSSASISLFETGKVRNPRIELLHKMAEVLEIPVSSLLEKAGASLPDVESGQVQWLVGELDLPNRRRLIAIGHALLLEQKDRPEKGDPPAARPSPRK